MLLLKSFAVFSFLDSEPEHYVVAYSVSYYKSLYLCVLLSEQDYLKQLSDKNIDIATSSFLTGIYNVRSAPLESYVKLILCASETDS